MIHLPLKTARSAHCVPRCKSLMSLKHPEILELSVKRFSVLYTDRDERQCVVKRHINLRTIAKLKVHAELDMATRFGCRHTTK